jgi:hypothetical protein
MNSLKREGGNCEDDCTKMDFTFSCCFSDTVFSDTTGITENRADRLNIKKERICVSILFIDFPAFQDNILFTVLNSIPNSSEILLQISS